MVSDSPVPLAIAVALGVVFALGLVLGRPVKLHTQAERLVDRTLLARDETLKVSVRALALGRLPMRWLILRERLPDGAITDSPVAKLTFGGGQDARFTYGIAFPSRGVYALGPIEVAYGDPLGVAVHQASLGEALSLLVHPPIVPMVAPRLPSLRPMGDRLSDDRAVEDPTRPTGVRPYAAGDSMRRIHWRATARVGAPMSKLYDSTSDPVIVVIPDLHAGHYATDADRELAITATVSVIAALDRDGLDSALFAGTMIRPDRGKLHVERCLAEAARAEFGTEELGARLLQIQPLLPWRASLLVVGQAFSQLDEAVLETLHRQGHRLGALLAGSPEVTAKSRNRLAQIPAYLATVGKEDELGRARFIAPGSSR